MGKPKTKYHILENEQQLDMLIDACKKTGYASVDFETTGNRIYNNDFYPTILGVCFEPGRAGVIPLGHFDSKFKKSWKTKLQKFGEEVIANENIVKVAWNAKFDMQVFHKYGIFHKGRLFDGMLAKYVLDEAKPNDLKSMVRRFLPKFGDYEEDYEGCNLPWDQKPLLGLSQYCAIDTDMCLRLFLFFEKKMIDKKFYHLFRNLIMPASNLLTKVETRGQRLDKEWHGKLMEEYPRRILEAETKVRALKKVKRFEKSLIQQRLDKAISKIEEEIRESKKVIKTSDDSRKIASAERSIKNREEKIARLMAGEFNTKSEKAIIEPINFGSASQMTQLLFTDPKGFKFPVVKYTQKDKRDTDNPSSSEAVLLELQKTDKTGFIDTLLELRGLKQINNMFVKGFANLVQDDGRLHPKFNIHGTRTGRLSSADPNSQQLPRVATDPTIRRCLVASPGRLYLMMDYSQCIDGDSYIFCNTGIKKLKEIIPGKDKICMIDPQHKNKHRVLNINVLANKGKAECLRITTNTGRQLILTEEHPVKSKQGFTLAKDLKLNDTLYIENPKDCYPQGFSHDELTENESNFESNFFDCGLNFSDNDTNVINTVLKANPNERLAFIGGLLTRGLIFSNYPKSFQALQLIFQVHGLAISWYSKLVWAYPKDDFMYEQITNIEKVGKREVYDMEVENLHEFNPNGIRVHNCELRLMAHLSKCKGLLEAFAKGWDPHLSVACKKYGVNYDDIYPIYKDEQHPDYTTWKIRRKQAKHIVFGCIYHIGAAKLAEELSDPKTGLVVTPKESQGFLDDFFKDFPEVKKFMDNQMKFIHKHGYIKTLFGRKRRCPEIFGDNQMQIVAAENAAINTPSQSAASDMALFTSILIDELIQKGEFPDLQEVGTVHDSIYFDTLPQDINPKTVYQLWDMARNPSTKEWFGFQIDDIDMSMDFEVGRSQGEELPFAVGYDYNRLLNFKGEWKGSKEEEYYFSLVNKCKSVDIKDYPKVYPEYFK
jgi:DNA polymerase I-like protein with 3'-5' exonuclease and polymerase domains